ncbi:MAG: hypothetical protein GF335_02975 [Candidatus Moranbacteria bacterium]|nr:hypothetical protein [Candidatus Moranbacteria bacterium]
MFRPENNGLFSLEATPEKYFSKKEKKQILALAMTKIENLMKDPTRGDIDIEKFTGINEKVDQEINAASAYVDYRKQEFKKQEELSKKYGTYEEKKETELIGKIWEEILFDQIKNWIGEKVKMKKVSKYDDYRNGIDGVAEIDCRDQTRFLALALDATRGDPLRKIKTIKESIDKNQIGKLDFFQTNQGDLMKIKNIPKVVIAVKDSFWEIADLWVKEDFKALSNHPVQNQILQQIIAQLETYQKYATENKKKEIAAAYRTLLEIFKAFEKDKGKKQQILEGDIAHTRLLKALEKFNKL